MSNPVQQHPTSQIAGYCSEIAMLSRTLAGMISRCVALGMPFGEDRVCITELEPNVAHLLVTLQAALRSHEPNPDEEPVIPLHQRANGARNIEWSSPTTSTTSATHAAATTTVVENGPLASTTPTDTDPAAAALVGVDGPLPSVDRCAELLMDDLCRDAAEVDPAEEGEVTLQGTNQSLAIPAVFEFLGRTGKTGTLRVKTNAETMRFEFARGDIVFSSTDRPPAGQRLGEILVDLGFVGAEALEALLAKNVDSARLGAALEREECIALPMLRRALEEQMRNRLDRAFFAEQSAFTFSEGGPESADQRVRMNVPQLLLEHMS